MISNLTSSWRIASLTIQFFYANIFAFNNTVTINFERNELFAYIACLSRASYAAGRGYDMGTLRLILTATARKTL